MDRHKAEHVMPVRRSIRLKGFLRLADILAPPGLRSMLYPCPVVKQGNFSRRVDHFDVDFALVV